MFVNFSYTLHLKNWSDNGLKGNLVKHLSLNVILDDFDTFKVVFIECFRFLYSTVLKTRGKPNSVAMFLNCLNLTKNLD